MTKIYRNYVEKNLFVEHCVDRYKVAKERKKYIKSSNEIIRTVIFSETCIFSQPCVFRLMTMVSVLFGPLG